jgi:hypothetical protein
MSVARLPADRLDFWKAPCCPGSKVSASSAGVQRTSATVQGQMRQMHGQARRNQWFTTDALLESIARSIWKMRCKVKDLGPHT